MSKQGDKQVIASQRQYIQQLEIQLVRLHDKFVHVVQQLAHNEHSQLHALLPQLRNWRRSGAGRAQQQQQLQSHRLQLGGSEEQSGNGASNELQVELALADLQFSSDQPQEININDPNFWNREIEEVLWRTRTHMVSRRAAAQPISRRMHTSLSSDDEDPDLAVPPILTEQQQQILSARIEDYEDEEQQQLQQYEDGMDSEFDEPGESLHSSAADAPLMEIAQQPRKRKLENQREVQAKKKKKKKKKSSKDAKLQVSEIQQQDGKKRQSWLKREDQVCGEFAQFLGQSVISRVEAYKRVWQYIKSKKLQRDPTNKKKIYCDETLLKLLNPEEQTIPNMWSLNTLIQKLFISVATQQAKIADVQIGATETISATVIPTKPTTQAQFIPPQAQSPHTPIPQPVQQPQPQQQQTLQKQTQQLSVSLDAQLQQLSSIPQPYIAPLPLPTPKPPDLGVGVPVPNLPAEIALNQQQAKPNNLSSSVPQTLQLPPPPQQLSGHLTTRISIPATMASSNPLFIHAPLISLPQQLQPPQPPLKTSPPVISSVSIPTVVPPAPTPKREESQPPTPAPMVAHIASSSIPAQAAVPTTVSLKTLGSVVQPTSGKRAAPVFRLGGPTKSIASTSSTQLLSSGSLNNIAQQQQPTSSHVSLQSPTPAPALAQPNPLLANKAGVVTPKK